MRKGKPWRLLFLSLSILFSSIAYAGRCSGSSNCHACSSCNYCKHCAQNGGSCGVCAGGASGISAGKVLLWLFVGGAVLYMIGNNDKRNK